MDVRGSTGARTGGGIGTMIIFLAAMLLPFLVIGRAQSMMAQPRPTAAVLLWLVTIGMMIFLVSAVRRRERRS